MPETQLIPMWLLLAAGSAFLVPWGVALAAAGALPPNERRQIVALVPIAFALTAVGYFISGFAIHYGGIGLLVEHPDLDALVWEWSALSADWGATWGMAGLAGFGLAGARTAVGYLLLLATLPWATTTTLLPMLALHRRIPAALTLFFGALTAFLGYPLLGNWIQGGGWLANLGENIGSGHGFVDFGGDALFLLGGGVTFAVMLMFSRRHQTSDPLPPAELSLPAVLAPALILAGSTGWLLAWPLTPWEQISALAVVVHALLAAAGGGLAALFVPRLSTRGLIAGWVAGLASAPFIAPASALIIGAVAGLLMLSVDKFGRRRDYGGLFATFGLPALWGLLALAIFADGTAGAGYNGIGPGDYLGVTAQGVTGLRPAVGFIADWPGQFQAQGIGVAVIFLLGFLGAVVLAGPVTAAGRIWRGRGQTGEEEDHGEDGNEGT